ncbi:hypothetical protein ACFYSJ_04835 [Streptomyces sp. NPDC005248]|uniref:hypothetical protein n=1 Tax=Streptomyces sp. NPDC005248 TaxID=3364709 RepID=UPI0036BBCDA6
MIAADLDGARMDCWDEETAHLWVRVIAWSPRRAFLTGASPFVEASGKTPEELVGCAFLTELDLNNPPGNEDTTGERLEWPGLKLCPPFDLDRFLGRQGRVDGAPVGGEA